MRREEQEQARERHRLRMAGPEGRAELATEPVKGGQQRQQAEQADFGEELQPVVVGVRGADPQTAAVIL